MISKIPYQIIFGLFIFFLAVSNSLGQSLGSIEGKVLDATTTEFIPGATVYLANTAIGMAANDDGTFLLGNITSGRYDLIVSMIGYKTFTKSIVFSGGSIVGLKIFLVANAEELKTVEVVGKKSLSYFSDFKKVFLGQTLNALQCKIVNQNDVYIYKEGSKLIAVAHKPIEIINNALGYRIYYDLKEFVIDYENNISYVSGIPRFEKLLPKTKRQEVRWIKERDRAYYGSIEHFIRSLKQKALKKNKFELSDLDRHPLSEGMLFKSIGDSIIVYKGNLKVSFIGELPELPYAKGGVQESTLNFVGRPVIIYDNGFYKEFHDITLQGYMGWSSGLSEIVPLGYQPRQ